MKTVPQLVAEAAAIHGERVAIRDGEVELSYRALDAARRQVAGALAAMGLQKGERIAIWAPNMYQWILAALGAQTLGGVMVPLNTRLKGGEAGYILRASGARWLFTVPDFLGVNYPETLAGESLPDLQGMVMLEGRHPGSLSWDDFLARAAQTPDAEVQERAAALSPDDTLDILFTSGTTGKPKGVVTAHGQNIRAFATWSDTVGLRAEDNYLIINPFFHTFGYKAGWLSAIICGAKILPVRQFDLDAVLEQIARDRVSMIPGPPTIYQSLLAHPQRAEYDLSSLRLAVTGAAPVPVKLVEQMREVLGFQAVVTAYGLTETCGVVSICRPDDSAERISHSSGRAMAGVEMKCVDAGGDSVPPGTEGEIWCRGFNVMQGYLDNPEATAQTITADGWLRTGDIGVLDEDGYVRITDRLKDMFIVGGFNCYPAEIENTLCDMPGVARAAVIGVPDERMGEVARAYIVAASGADLDEAAVIAWSRQHMANYKVPRSVRFLDAFPMNAGGKVLKNELRELAAGEAKA
ncbi:FadD3 family acyl-CoA ligase [Parahaliea mediterranea]|uniref:Fatty acid--CoA ligase family protein n=1 Tax=Parahaliea mediterranea TaxID=651086 RepID=A0A939DCN4_9GAMM|nr:FadD3 family acyl-CoA ligase [Parahaliea mediterranea]MBN7795147.1 fatty acid--CoA ligase family protein [Parahaliea mediterranea]